jgi:hypothetical protein
MQLNEFAAGKKMCIESPTILIVYRDKLHSSVKILQVPGFLQCNGVN